MVRAAMFAVVVLALGAVTGCHEPKGLAKVDVVVAISPAGVTMESGQTAPFEAEDQLVSGGRVESRDACIKCEWSVDNPQVARITGRTTGTSVVLEAVGPGETKLWAGYTPPGGLTRHEASAAIKVNPQAAPVAARVTITPSSGQVEPGQTTNFACAALDAGGQAITAVLDWTSSAVGVATVDAAGRVLGAADGTATITCTVRGTAISASAVVTVRSAARLVSVAPPEAVLAEGNALMLDVTVRHATTNESIVLGDITASSSNAVVATVALVQNSTRRVQVTGLTVGTATITVRYLGSGGGEGTAVVTVVAANSNAVLTTPQFRAVVRGQTITVGGGVVTQAGQSVPNTTVNWRSETPNIATVSGNTVTAVSAGVATIVGESSNAIPARQMIQVVDQQPTCSASQANLTFATSVLNDPARKAAQYNVPATLSLSAQVNGNAITITGPMGTATGTFTPGTCNFVANGTGPIGSLPSVNYRFQGYFGSPGQVVWALFVEPTGTVMTQYRLDKQ